MAVRVRRLLGLERNVEFQKLRMDDTAFRMKNTVKHNLLKLLRQSKILIFTEPEIPLLRSKKPDNGTHPEPRHFVKNRRLPIYAYISTVSLYRNLKNIIKDINNYYLLVVQNMSLDRMYYLHISSSNLPC